VVDLDSTSLEGLGRCGDGDRARAPKSTTDGTRRNKREMLEAKNVDIEKVKMATIGEGGTLRDGESAATTTNLPISDGLLNEDMPIDLEMGPMGVRSNWNTDLDEMDDMMWTFGDEPADPNRLYPRLSRAWAIPWRLV